MYLDIYIKINIYILIKTYAFTTKSFKNNKEKNL